MPLTSKAKNPKGIEIVFREDDHSYTSIINEKTIRYTSGTTFIGKFFPEFDPTGEITKRCAKKQGLTVESLKKQWRDKADESCRKGTFIHELCENILKDRPYNDKSEWIDKGLIKIAKMAATKLKDQVEILDAEKIVFDPYLKHPIAGTIDILAKSKKDGSILVLDWKTNSKIETSNTFKNFGNNIISHVPAINYHEYSMQLSLYRYLLVHGGYFPEETKFKTALIHLTENRSKIYPLVDYYKEIKDMIKYSEEGNLNI